MDTPTIISLTSYPARIGTVIQTIRSLLDQTVKPWKIVLWLTRSEFPGGEAALPPDLLALAKESIFVIDWADENYRSYNKLVHSLRKYPDCCLVTVDDDIVYPADMLSRLLVSHRRSPADIQALFVRVITAQEGKIRPFLDWLPSWLGSQGSAYPSFDNSLLGFGGVLYPPHCLDNRVLDMALAQSVCPNADDLWFWAMAVLKGTRINGVSSKGYVIDCVNTAHPGSLWELNRDGGNDAQFAKLLERFPELRQRLSLSRRPLPKVSKAFHGALVGHRDGPRKFSFLLSVPLFQMVYNDDFSRITYYILRIPVFRRRCGPNAPSKPNLVE